MRYLGVDLGDKRTGLALGDSETRIAAPVDVIELPREREGGAALLRAIARALEEHIGDGRAEIVLGLPLNMDGTEGDRAIMTRAFGQRLAAQTGRTVHYHDERLSTAAADEKMARTGLTHGKKKARRDALAAAAMLQGFLDERSSP